MAVSARRKYWKLLEPPPRESLARFGMNDIVATLLYHRLVPLHYEDSAGDMHLAEAAASFLDATYSDGLHDPFLLKGMAEASDRLARAIVEQEPMAVYGDFDTDGVTAVALLMQAISAMGGVIQPYIPHRDREGYGLNIQAIEWLAAQGVGLLITVDCGITNVAEVERANELGMDVVVTDHHRPPPILPPALAVVNPKQPDCPYPDNQLVGVGIAFKLVQALAKRHNLRPPNLRARDMLDVVALGTVSDMGPLIGENRVLVKAGIAALRETRRPGLIALMQVSGVSQKTINALSIGFSLGPRINAAGRMDDAALAYDLLLSDDLATAQRLAHELNIKNRERQELTRQVMEQASAQAEQTNKHRQRIVVLASTDYPAGVVGLVAGKLVEQWARPVILLARGEEVARASARSIPAFNIYRALLTCEDLFVRFGGHSMAAGFTIANEHIPELETRLQRLAADHLSDELLQPTLYIDAEVDLAMLDWPFFDELARLEPFGQANQQPILMTRNVQAVDIKTVGEGKHLKLRVVEQSPDQSHRLDAIAFGLGHLAEPLQKHPRIDMAYTLEVHTWNNEVSLQLNVKDFRRARFD